MGTDGEGIGHYDGMTFFVKDALIGDVITARATKLKKNYGYARVEEIKTPSTFRVEPQCELHKRCGGCQIQALSFAQYICCIPGSAFCFKTVPIYHKTHHNLL